MKKFILFVGGLIALSILMVNLGPMVLLGFSIWLLYIIFKQFVKSDSTAGKIGWVLLGLLVLSMGLANIYAILGIVAAYGLYIIIKNWKEEARDPVSSEISDDDPFENFERQWEELNY